MADFFYGLVLGIVQGLGEFLPISSSGHLELAKYIFNDKSLGQESILLSVILHFGTACSTLYVFRREIVQLIKGILSKEMNEQKKFAIKVVISMIPAAIIGLLFEKQMEVLFEGKVMLVCFFLICTSILLFVASRSSRSIVPLDNKNAFFIGLAQAIALLPGISRSGSTIATSVILGIDKKDGAQFSFLMVLPLIFGKIGKDVLDGAFTQTNLSPTIAITGVITSFIIGVWACTTMVELVKKSKLQYFAVYCAIVGIGGLLYFFINK